MKKKIAAFLLIFSMLPCNFAIAEKETIAFSKNVNILSAFGIINRDADIQSDAYVTRGEFAGFLAKAMRLTPNNQTGFTDVYEDNLAAVSALEKYNVVYGNGVEYKPDDIITNQDAAVMIMRALGYEKAAEFAGGYPGGYLSYANDEGITDGVEGKIYDYAQSDTIVRMLSNMLEANIYVVKINEGDSFSYEQGETFMEKYYNAHKVTGILQGNNKVNINGLAFTGGDNEVTFEYQNYLTAIDLSDYLGYNLTVYYISEDDINTIIYAEEHKTNNVTSILGYDAEKFDFDSFVLSYETDGKIKKLDFYNGTNFILNNEYVDDIENTNLDPDDGEIKAIDNNGDGNVDLFVITKHSYIIAEKISVNEEFVVDKITGEKIELDIEELEITQNGETASFESIKANSLLEVIKDFDGKIKEIKVYEPFTGKCVGYSDEEINIDGEGLKLSNFLKKNEEQGKTEKIIIGNNVTYYKNSAGRVVWLDSDAAEKLVYGYLINIYNDDEIERDIFKLLTEDGIIERITAAKRVTLNGTKTVGTGFNLRPEFTENTVNVKRQLIMYQKNINGEINKLLTARDTLEDAVKNGADPEFAKNYGDIDAIFSNKDKFSLDYYTQTEIRHVKGRFYSTFGINAETVIFNVPNPEETIINDQDFYLGTAEQFNGDRKYKDLYFYDFDEALNAAVLVNYRKKTETIGESLLVVDSVYTTLDKDDEIRSCVSGYKDGKIVEYVAEDSNYLSQASDWGTLYNKDYSNIGWGGLKRGDILFYGLNNSNEMTAFRLCAHDIKTLDADYMLGGYSSVAVIDGRDSYGASQFCTGEVSKTENGVFFVKTKTTTGIEVIRRLQSAGYIYILENNKLTIASFDDMAKGDRVVVMCRYDVPVITVIVKE